MRTAGRALALKESHAADQRAVLNEPYPLFQCAAYARVLGRTSPYDRFPLGAKSERVNTQCSNVKPAGFGRLYSYFVNGSVYAQPLYVAGPRFADAALATFFSSPR
jgi:hypothetical protein